MLVLDLDDHLFDTSPEFMKHGLTEWTLFQRIQLGELSYTPLVGASRLSPMAKGKARGRAAAKKTAQAKEVETPPRHQAWRGNPRDDLVRFETFLHL